MNDDKIRALLTSVPPSGWIDRTPGTVAILRSRVEEAGGDPDAVSWWVRAHGGRVDRTPAYYRRGFGPRNRLQETAGREFYVVPTEALTAEARGSTPFGDRP
ncbi:MAG: hypothetical protein ACR2NB_07755 [Solirubrobacteraceae bacterium]